MGRLLASIGVLCATFAQAPHAAALAGLCSEAAPIAMLDVEDAHADAPLPSPLRDEELPWCASADDPRCAPLDNSRAPSSVGVRKAPAIEVAALPTEAIAEAAHDFMPHAGLAPSAGTSSRLERPPRAARRLP
jgi:hypothetical protein